jgi:hypothetical protein
VRTLVAPSGRIITALIGAPALTEALGASTRTAPGDPVRAAHEVLVRSAMVLLEAPGREGRALLLLPPIGFDPDPRFATALLDGFAAATWLAPQGPVAMVANARTPRERAELVETDVAAPPARLRDALTTTATSITLLAGALDPSGPDGDPDRVVLAQRTLAELDDELLRASSHAYAARTETAVARLDVLRAAVDAGFGSVTLSMTDVTLTDRDGILPLALEHVGPLPLRLQVTLTSPAALGWPQGTTRAVFLDVEQRIELTLPVRSGSTGVFPVTVTVTDPSGRRVLAEETVSVRATALAGPALSIIGVVVLTLTIAGLVRQRRRGPRTDREPRPGLLSQGDRPA